MSGTRSLLLIRHGQASFGAEDYDRLSPVGEQQSRQLGRWLAGCRQVPDLVVTGPRERHRRTAELCLAAAGVTSTPMMLDGLDEVDHQELLARLRPDLSGPGALRAELQRSSDPHRAFQAWFAEAIARWVGGAHDAEYTLTWPRFRSQVLATLDTLAADQARTIWAFTSGGPIAVLANALTEAPPAQSFKLSWPLVNTGITRVRLGRQGAALVTYNAWPHLEHAGDETLVTLR